MSRPALPVPEPEDMDQVLAALEAQLTEVPEHQAEQLGPSGLGETERVRRLRAELAEAERMAALLAEDTRVHVPTRREQRRIRRAAAAMRAHQLSQTPELVAARDARVRRWTTLAALVSAVLALAWSTAGVQRSVATADGLQPGQVGYLLAYLVEPMMSVLLLALVGGQAYAALRGRRVDRRSESGRTIARAEVVLLLATLTLNIWPHLGGLWREGAVLPVVVHCLGPIVAVVAVRSLPALWAVLDGLPLPSAEGAGAARTPGRTAPRTEARTGPEYRANAPSTGGRTGTGIGAGPSVAGPQLDPARLAALTARARDLVASGELPAQASSHQIRAVLRCGMDYARAVRDALGGGR